MLDKIEKNVVFGIVSLYDFENNAVRILAALTRAQGYKAVEIYFKDWKNNYFEPPTEVEINNLLTIIHKQGINLLGMSVRATAYHNVATQLTQAVKKKYDIPVIWGGTHVLLSPDMCIEATDAVCVSEGEVAMLELFRRIKAGEPLQETPGLWINEKGEILKNPMKNLCEDLDTLPFRDYTSSDKYVVFGSKIRQEDPMVIDPVYRMMCSRGCPFNCAYCYNSAIVQIYKDKGRYHRIRSVDSVLAELKDSRNSFKNLKRIRFDDEVFIFQDQWVDEFCERYPREIGLPFEIFTEPKLVKLPYMEKLRKAGLDVVYMGVQNSYRITKELYDRNTAEDTILGAGKIFHDLRIDARYQIIVDDPLSNEEDRETLFDLLTRIPRPYELYLFSLTVFPNTTLASKLLKEGLISEKDVEGTSAQKTFKQMRVSLNYPRPPIETFWVSILVLISKNFIPLWLIKSLAKNEFLMHHPLPLVIFAQVSNVIKMTMVVLRMIVRGEFTITLLRRWTNLRSLITQ
ncbi:MAG: B12-binding domain-containing radical SAM protein [Candidatus Xenobiia bacterium LiM19]